MLPGARTLSCASLRMVTTALFLIFLWMRLPPSMACFDAQRVSEHFYFVMLVSWRPCQLSFSAAHLVCCASVVCMGYLLSLCVTWPCCHSLFALSLEHAGKSDRITVSHNYLYAVHMLRPGSRCAPFSGVHCGHMFVWPFVLSIVPPTLQLQLCQ